MAMETSARSGEKNVQDWINLVCAVLLFISPWILGSRRREPRGSAASSSS